ncbi:MAG: nuclear transport factor 2 family protein [Candidatus Thiodiazotropha taylori]|nr:nuclear transport factor 2 family protein [Candidatus Thiodiazotropha taylori]MCG7941863.1 nuclear transport factor 2 family protein [Candidatus Thiodiazotropha taylori]MCG8080831.1 nuclear transport factor 2 family protein [Candidatus Thiodiazotropha taylori]
MSNIGEWLSRYSDFFESLDETKLEQCDQVFNQQIRFKDPFNDVVGIESVKQVFRHMFRVCETCQFEVSDSCGSGDLGYLHWKFLYRTKGSGKSRTIVGISQVRFNPQGEVVEHIDYWDSAEFVYEKLPLLGGVLSWIRKRYLQAV